MGSPERAQLLIASNRGPVTVEAVEGGEDEVRRGGGGLVSGMQTALAASPGAVWVCSASAVTTQPCRSKRCSTVLNAAISPPLAPGATWLVTGPAGRQIGLADCTILWRVQPVIATA